MRIIFVDGYNVINSWPNLIEHKNHSFYDARENLINALHNFAVYENCKIIIVFDAHKVKKNIEKKEIVNKNLNVVFTKDGETADSYIEREVHNLGRRIEVYVVTSDWLEQQTIFQRGAVRVSALEFYHEVLEAKSKIKKKAEKNNLIAKNHLGDNIDNETLMILETMRRSK